MDEGVGKGIAKVSLLGAIATIASGVAVILIAGSIMSVLTAMTNFTASQHQMDLTIAELVGSVKTLNSRQETELGLLGKRIDDHEGDIGRVWPRLRELQTNTDVVAGKLGLELKWRVN